MWKVANALLFKNVLGWTEKKHENLLSGTTVTVEWTKVVLFRVRVLTYIII
jgi:hypothetical protein